MNSRAISLPDPVYPVAECAAGVEGVINVQVRIDEKGNVVAASAISGPLRLRAAAVVAARNARFSPPYLSAHSVKIIGILVYDFKATRKVKAIDAISCFPGRNWPFNGNVLNKSAVSLPKPVYPAAAGARRLEGTVAVRVQVDETGNVVYACALSGHRLLRAAAKAAAGNAKIKPTVLSGKAIKTSGLLVYYFAAPPIE